MRKILLLGWLAASAVWGEQVLLRVRFAQMDARAEAMLAANLTATGNAEIRVSRSGVDLLTLLEDLRARGGGLRVVAEPALLASEGKPVTLLVGDRVAVPVMRDGEVMIERRDLGVQLWMQPTVSADGIRLAVRPSVSTLKTPEVLITVPAIGTRTAEAEVSLQPGQSMVIDGLFGEAAKSFLRNLPGNGMLDAILKNGTQAGTKLLVMVTPEVI